MKLILNDKEPIFVQVAKFIEDLVIEDVIQEEMQIPSTTEFAKVYRINPATVLKGMNLLVDRAIVYKKRGIGMFVTEGAKACIQKHRKESFTQVAIEELMKEARKLGITKEEIIEQILKCGEVE